jgi:hypothetical protein
MDENIKPKNKTISLEELESWNHIGFENRFGDKAYIVYTANDEYTVVSSSEYESMINLKLKICNDILSHSSPRKLLFDCVSRFLNTYDVENIYKFEDRKSLYKWLSE